MSPRLHAEDCRIVDLLLDGAAVAEKSTVQSVFAGADGLFRQRLVKSQKMLGLLEHIPVADPPKYLLDRTLKFVKAASGRDVTIRHLQPPTYGAQPPVA